MAKKEVTVMYDLSDFKDFNSIFLSPFESIEERLEKIKNRKTWKTNL
jgi:hypothetical protein